MPPLVGPRGPVPGKLQMASHNGGSGGNSRIIRQQKSFANELLISTRIPPDVQNSLKKTVFVSKIPKEASNQLMERLLKSVGSLLSWKRSVADPNRPQTFGLAEFEDLETVYACIRTMNNLKIYENNILIKAD